MPDPFHKALRDRRLTTLFGSLFRAAITLVLLAAVFWKFDFSTAEQKLASGNWELLLLALVAAVLNVPLVAMRWLMLLRKAQKNCEITATQALQLTWIGLLFSQVLPGGVAGDISKGWLAHTAGSRLSSIVASLLTDRITALLALVLMLFVSLPEAGLGHSQLLRILFWSVAIFLLCTSIVLLIFPSIAKIAHLFGQVAARLASLGILVRQVLLSRSGAAAILLSLIVLSLSVTSAILIASSLGTKLDPVGAFFAVSLGVLAATLPISIGGWGVREATMVISLGMLGISQSEATSISVLLGLNVLVSALPGILFWAFLRMPPRRDILPPSLLGVETSQS